MYLYKILVFIIINIVLCIEGTPNQCCLNNKQIIGKGMCENNETLLIKQMCDRFYKSLPNETIITENDDLFIKYADTLVNKNKYCVGEMRDEKIILICFPEITEPTNNNIAMLICMIISIFCLIVTIVVYAILPRLRDLLGKCIMCTIFSLLVAFIFLAVIQKTSEFSYTPCYFIATSIYFWFLGAFFWMNVVAFHIWRSMANPSYPRNAKRVFKYYNIYGWGTPLLILIIAKLSYHLPGEHIKPTWTIVSCWFSDYTSAIIYFHIPTAILLTANVIIFILSAWELRKQGNNSINNKLRSRKYKFLLCLKLFLTMGICWIFEPISFILKYEVNSNIWLITDFLNCLQGLVIFLLLVVFRKRVRRDLARHKGICCQKLPQDWATIADDDCDELSDDAEKTNDQNETETYINS